MEEYHIDIQNEIRESMFVKEKSLKLVPKIAQAAKAIVDSYKKGGKLILFGNGGSAADAQHIAAELVNYLHIKDRPPLNSIALTVNPSILTSISNDFSYEEVFSKQIQALANENDVVIGMSTSGNSKNVINGLEEAKRKGCFIIGMTAESGGAMKDLPHILLNSPSPKTNRAQEIHILIGHILCSLVERELYR